MITRVYKYSIHSPVENVDLVFKQLLMMNDFRSRHAELEIRRRVMLRSLESTPEIITLETAVANADVEVKTAIEAIKNGNKAARSKVDTAEMRVAVKIARTKKTALQTALSTKRADIRANSKEYKEILSHEYFLAAEKIYNDYSEITWGNRQIVNRSIKQAFEMYPKKGKAPACPLYEQDRITPHDPPLFTPFKGEGVIGVQLQGGLTVDKLTTDTQFQIIAAPPREVGKANRNNTGANKPKAVGKFDRIIRMRIGSDEKRRPIWASFKMTMHRPLPEDVFVDGQLKKVLIMRAQIKCQKVGPHMQWTLTITCDVPTPETIFTPGCVALNFGWRQMSKDTAIYRPLKQELPRVQPTFSKSPVRVATFVDDKGHSEHFVIDVSGWERADQIGTVKKHEFNRQRDETTAWINTNSAIVPTELALKAKTISQWESANRLTALTQYWAENRFAGDEEIYGRHDSNHPTDGSPCTCSGLAGWRHHNLHLWQYEIGVRKNYLNSRRNLFKHWANELVAKYGTVITDNTDYSKLAQHKEVDSEEVEIEKARANRQKTACGELRSTVLQAFVGGTRIVLPSNHITHTCHVCARSGVLTRDIWDAKTDLTHTCSQCGSTWDQDVNAGHNLCERGSGVTKSDPAREVEYFSGYVEKGEGLFQKIRRKKLEKLALEAAAREVSDNVAE